MPTTRGAGRPFSHEDEEPQPAAVPVENPHDFTDAEQRIHQAAQQVGAALSPIWVKLLAKLLHEERKS